MREATRLVAFVETSRPDAARRFYTEVVGLSFAGDMGHALQFDTAQGLLTVVKTDTVIERRGTTVGWTVPDLPATVRALAARGAVFERFEGMAQDDLGVWRTPGGGGVAWFKDPDGNLLSVSTA